MRKQYDTDLKIHAVRLATGVSPSIAQVTTHGETGLVPFTDG